MESLEKSDEIVNREERILSHKESPRNILELQMLLAEELYEADHRGQHPEFAKVDGRNEILNYWVSSEYSTYFRMLMDERQKGGVDPMNIELQELIDFRKTREALSNN